MELSIRLTLVVILFWLGGCTGVPRNIDPVQGFELERYLGKWYEIARLDHSFESGLSQVTADYQRRDDGGVSVLNRGYSNRKGWDSAQGKAYFVGDKSAGHLKVSFFGPFYGSYIIFELDKRDYQYAFVTSYNKEFLWFLSRTPTVSEELKEYFIRQVKARGFDISELIFVEHSTQEIEHSISQ